MKLGPPSWQPARFSVSEPAAKLSICVKDRTVGSNAPTRPWRPSASSRGALEPSSPTTSKGAL